jgi:hypothetical protein
MSARRRLLNINGMGDILSSPAAPSPPAALRPSRPMRGRARETRRGTLCSMVGTDMHLLHGNRRSVDGRRPPSAGARPRDKMRDPSTFGRRKKSIHPRRAHQGTAVRPHGPRKSTPTAALAGVPGIPSRSRARRRPPPARPHWQPALAPLAAVLLRPPYAPAAPRAAQSPG